MILTWSIARRCSYGDKVLGRVDDRWALYVNGPSNQNGSFDGIVSNANSTYPGLSLYDPTLNFLAQLSDHNNILYTDAGVQQISAAMNAIGMSRAGGSAPVASISGPTDFSGAQTMSWTASASGGNGSYTYAWSYQVGSGSWASLGTGATASRRVYATSPDFSLQLVVTSSGQTTTVTEPITGPNGSCIPPPGQRCPQ